MAYWLFKSEPVTWSWDMQKAKGDAGEEWGGVRNYQARNNMRAMKLGDKGFFYHSNEGLEVVGIVEVCAKIGKASCRDRVCKYVYLWVRDVTLHTKKTTK